MGKRDSSSSTWLDPATPSHDGERRPLGRALSVSVAAHAAFGLLLLIAVGVQSTPVDTKAPPVKLNAVYLPLPGPMGGGGGNPAPAPPRPVEVPHHDVAPPTPVTPAAAVEPPKPTMDLAIETNAAKLLQATGSSTVSSTGPGGGGRGRSAGPGDGPGVGPGSDGNTGGGPKRPGGDVLAPTLIRSVDPAYTSEALVAKLTGTVELEAVVLADGTVGQVRVTKSLDTVHGLDREALIAARKWLFHPGTQGGRPVDVIVKLVLEFHIR